MDGVSIQSNRNVLRSDKVYDCIVFIYIVALFVLENEEYAKLFYCIQFVFVGYSCLKIRIFDSISISVKWCFAIFLFSSLLAVINDTIYSYNTLAIIVKNLVRFLCFSIYMQDESHVENVIKYVAVAGIICCLYIFFEFRSSDMNYNNIRQSTNSRIGADIAGGNVNIVALNLGIAFTSWMYIQKKFTQKVWKAFSWGILLCIALCSFLTGTRKLIPFYILTIILFNYHSRKNTIPILLFTLAMYAALMYIEPLYYLLGHKVDFFRENDYYTMYYDTNSDRMNLASWALDLFFDKPWGIGFGNTLYYNATYSHNNYLEVLVSIGVLGFLAYYNIYINGLIVGFKNKSSLLSQYIIVLTIGMLIIEINQVTYLYSVPVVVLSIIASYTELHKSKHG